MLMHVKKELNLNLQRNGTRTSKKVLSKVEVRELMGSERRLLLRDIVEVNIVNKNLKRICKENTKTMYDERTRH